ncbi:hypothetical protein VOLCADRAFT_116481 [Volvox carteri f. nagariensis]|uniref:Uncharacterized protein n=1 Tax=Volvox carteri f. nagariensis TaxID=3068 RepID=D8TMF8_VOLCA|nr:uncharacterized protein VOLCADRAFT_116481 [Volvox carteri f. nagariensis]EFJ51118.1 hypothetical protein VOLCADRAFT_116481 [Volvox carteri f. nagariensis]|eukprot:XP_002947585.1 hypothetical protein VOLCADRAFT_116481 [Volvox carteri f. nagariensis]
MGEDLRWLIDLEPFPLTSGIQLQDTGLSCIGSSGSGCKWSSATEYINSTGSDTYIYIPLGLEVQAKNITRLLQFGHNVFAGLILRQLKTLSITCTDPVPVFAPYVLQPLIMALAAANTDTGQNATASGTNSSPPPPPPPSSNTNITPANHTSDAAVSNVSTILLAYSRLYRRPNLEPSLLQSLSIQDCALTGQLPPESSWLQLPSLERLDLSRNQLTGPLPATFGPSPPLSYLNLSHNRLSGPLTDSLMRYGGCGRTLDLSYNDIRGTLPDTWLSSACTSYDMNSIGLSAVQRRLLQQEGGPDGGVAKVATSTILASRAAKPLTPVTEGTTPSSYVPTPSLFSASISDAYAFWLSYSTSYMYGSDGCPLLGVAWRESSAGRIYNDTWAGNGTAAALTPFNFTVLLYGNPKLWTPGGHRTGYAIAASRYLSFHIRDNACTIFEPLLDLLWVWGTFGTIALAVLLAAVAHSVLAARKARKRVAPASKAQSRRALGGISWKRSLGQEFAWAAAALQGAGDAPAASRAVAPAAAATVPVSGESAVPLSGPSGQRVGNPMGSGSMRSDDRAREVGTAAEAAGAASPFGSRAGVRGMASLVIVAHARRSVHRLSQYGNNLLGGVEVFGGWLVNDIPWGPVIRAIVTVAVHVGAAFLCYAMSLPQRTEYCTSVRNCGRYLYIVPPALSGLSIGLTLFLMRATRELAASMASRVAASKPDGGGGGSGKPDSAKEVAGDKNVEEDRGSESGENSRGSNPTETEGSRDGTESRQSPETPRRRPSDSAGAVGESWVYGQQPIRGSGVMPPSLNEPQEMVGLAKSLPLYDTRVLPAPEGVADVHSMSSGGLPSPSVIRRNLGVVTANQPSWSDLGRETTTVGLGGRGCRGSGGSVRSPLTPQDHGKERTVSVGAGGPVAESLASPATDNCMDLAAVTAVEAAERQERHNRGGLVGWLYGHGTTLAATSPVGTLLPASPYGLQHHVHGHGAVAGATRASAFLSSSFTLYRPRTYFEPGSSLGSVHDAESQACEALGGCGGTAATAAAATSVPLAVGMDSYAGASSGPGPLAEGRTRQMAVPHTPSSRLQRQSSPSQLRSSSQDRRGWSSTGGASRGGNGDYESSRASSPYGARIRRGDTEEESQDPTIDRGSGDGTARNTSRSFKNSQSRRAASRPGPVSVVHGTSPSGFSPRAVPSPVSPYRGGTRRRSSGDDVDDNDAYVPYSPVEPMRQDRSLVNSASSRGSVRSRAAAEAGPSSPNAQSGQLRGGRLPAQQEFPGSMDSRVKDVPSPMANSPSRRGGPWLEDRLAALATMSASSRVPPSATAAGTWPNPAAATAMGMPGPTPQRHGGGTAHAGGAHTGGAGMPRLKREALRVVNQYLREYALGKKGSGWCARAGRTVLSFIAVLMVYTPLAPLAVPVVLLVALVIVVHSAVSAIVAAIVATWRWCGRRLQNQLHTTSGTAAGCCCCWFRIGEFVGSLRLSINLLVSLHLHVSAWVLCLPLALFTGALYGLGYLWGKDAVPHPWMWLACNSTCLAGVLLLLADLAFRMPAWEYGVCRYPYVVVLRAAAAAGTPVATVTATVAAAEALQDMRR